MNSVTEAPQPLLTDPNPVKRNTIRLPESERGLPAVEHDVVDEGNRDNGVMDHHFNDNQPMNRDVTAGHRLVEQAHSVVFRAPAVETDSSSFSPFMAQNVDKTTTAQKASLQTLHTHHQGQLTPTLNTISQEITRWFHVVSQPSIPSTKATMFPVMAVPSIIAEPASIGEPSTVMGKAATAMSAVTLNPTRPISSDALPASVTMPQATASITDNPKPIMLTTALNNHAELSKNNPLVQQAANHRVLHHVSPDFLQHSATHTRVLSKHHTASFSDEMESVDAKPMLAIKPVNSLNSTPPLNDSMHHNSVKHEMLTINTTHSALPMNRPLHFMTLNAHANTQTEIYIAWQDGQMGETSVRLKNERLALEPVDAPISTKLADIKTAIEEPRSQWSVMIKTQSLPWQEVLLDHSEGLRQQLEKNTDHTFSIDVQYQSGTQQHHNESKRYTEHVSSKSTNAHDTDEAVLSKNSDINRDSLIYVNV